MGANVIGTLFNRPIGQSWEDLAAWEEVLNENTHVREIIEIGTYYGGMSCYLEMQAQARIIGFRSYDISVFKTTQPFSFYQMDVLEKTISLSYQDVILLCDGGNKKKEVEKYNELLTEDSILAVHDWLIEFTEKDIPTNWRIFKASSSTVFLMTHEHLNKREIKEGKRYG